ncbi:PQQ-binding-like beta-propeller repeat protein [Prosthecobacter sp.]|uniref:outer membrane protein assembly factor BamB family protein n=1 Tax=Prosthecobacter sp. TaxID=1965333 RepID=UPI001DC5CED1|nr:PQQ-binding-like beta-propeller repeat protein [Prosthecobacter sp.]MCB1277899.1 PQQ-like beta-propeller repeat protein [Prosthecobacter sp.]
MATRALFLSFLGLCLTAVSSHAESLWPEFRGPTAQGFSTAKGLPTEWAPDKNIVWRSEVAGKGWSSPVVANGKIFITTAVELPVDPAAAEVKPEPAPPPAAVAPKADGSRRPAPAKKAPPPPPKPVSLHVIALDAATGKALWDTPVFEAKDPAALKMHPKNSQASPSVIYEAGRLYAHFSHHGTTCLDEAGKIVWTSQENPYPPQHGTGGSPVLVDDLLIFDADGSKDPGVVALDKATGKTRWKIARPETEAKSKFSFCTPLVIEVAGQKQVISAGSGIVQALNPKDGSEIWHVMYGTGYSVVPRPVFAHGMIFMSTGYDKPIGLAIKVDGKGDVTNTHVVWQETKYVPHNPSMLVIGDELYMLADNGLFTCRDAKTNTVHFEERLLGPSSASLLYADGLIYAIDEKGASAVVKPGKTLQVVAKSELNEKTLASMAVCDNDLLIRTELAVYRVGKKSGAE